MPPSERNFTLHESWIISWKLQRMWADLESLCHPSIRQLSLIRSSMTRTLQAGPIVISPIGCPRSSAGHVTKRYWLVTLASQGISVRYSCCMGFCPVQLIVLCLLLWPLWYSLNFLEHRVPGRLPPLRWCEHAIPSSHAYRTEELPGQRGWSVLHMLLLILHVGEQVYLR